MNIQQIEQMLANAAAPVGQQKQNTVAEAAAQKKATLGGFDPYTASVGRQEGLGAASAEAAEQDFRNMSTMDLWAKYGEGAVMQRAAGAAAVSAEGMAQRDFSQAAADTVSGVGLGAFNGLAGIGALATGIVNTNAGNAMSQGIQSVNEAVMESQSPALQARRRLNQAMDANTQRDSTQQYEQDLDAGKSGFMAGASRIARDAGSAIANAAADPMTLMDGTAQALGSFATVGPMSRAASAINSKGILAARRAGLIGKDEARMLAKVADGYGTAALIGSMESGGVFQQTTNEVLGMDFAALQKNSPEFNKLVEEGLSMEEARATQANIAGLKASAYTFPAASVMGKFVANFERAPMTTASMKSGLANIGAQALEEAGQGGVGQMATNNAIQSTADKTRTTSEGVGAQMGTGALFGMTMSGTIQAPGMAALAARKAMARAVSGKNGTKEEEPSTPEPGVPTVGGIGQSLVPMTTDLKENVKSAAQISDAQEAMSIAASESIQNNPTLDDETKATQLNGMAVLEATFTYGEQDKQDIAQRKLPADMTSKLGTARNLPEAFSAVVDHVVSMSDKLGETGLTPEYMRSVIYLNEMEDRVQGLAQVEEISAIMDNMAEGSPEQQYLASVYQAMANIAGSQQTVAAQEQIRKRLGTAPVLAQVNLNNVDEALARARYAPETLSETAVADTLALADQGAIKLSSAQRAYLSGSKALAAAMNAAGSNANTNKVTHQIAFAEGVADSFKYPSLATHVSNITQAIGNGDSERATHELTQLRNFAETMINKAAAINESAGTKNKVRYRNWIPPKNQWSMSEKGLNADLEGSKSRDFLMRINTEAASATAAYESMAAQFPDLAEGTDALPALPELPAIMGTPAPTPQAPTSAPTSAQTPTPTPTPTAVAPATVDKTPRTSTHALEDLAAARTANDGPKQQEAVARFADDTLRSTLQQSRALVQRTKSEYAEGLHNQARALVKERSASPGKYSDPYLDEVTSLAEAVEKYRQEFEASTKDLFAEPNKGAKKPAVVEASTSPPKESGARPKLNVWAGTNENRELSNLAPRIFAIGREYFSVEHAYQSLKSGNFDQTTYDKYDRKGYKKITGNKGTKSENGWNIRLMEQLVWESFIQNPDAAKKLLATGNQEITHTQDRGVWAKEFPRILMEVRQRLQSAAPEPKTNPVSLEETFKGLLNEAEALVKMMFDQDLNANPTAYKLMADLEDAMTSLVEHTRTSNAEGLLRYIKNYIANVAEPGKGRSWDATDFHGLVLRAQYHLKDFTAQTAELSEESSAPPTTKSRITEEQAARLSDAGLNARIEAIQDKKEKTEEDQATFAVLDAEMTKRENAVVIAQKKKSPGVAAISKLDDAELNSRIRFIEQNNKPDALEKNSVYQALVAERSARNERANAAKSEPNTQVSKELALVNALAAKLKLPAVTAVREAAPEDGLQGAMYTYATGVITVDPRLKGNARLSIILHELGHHVVSQALAQELSLKPQDIGRMGQDELLAAMKKAVPEVAAEYESWLAGRVDVTTMGRSGVRVPISKSAMSKAVYSFIAKGGAAVNEIFNKKKRGVERTRDSTLHEWLADNIAKALESDPDTQGVIGKFFKRIANALKKMYEALAPDSNFLPAKSVQDWLKALASNAQEIREPDTAQEPGMAESVPENAATVQKTVLDGLDTLLSDMNNKPNVLVASFEAGSNPSSRIASMADPIAQVLDEVSTVDKFEEASGKKITSSKLAAIRDYISSVVIPLAQNTTSRVHAELFAKAKDGTKGSWIAQGALGLIPPDRQKYAFQMQEDGKGALTAVMDYAVDSNGNPTAILNYRLTASAALAAGQWFLSSGNSGSKKLDEGAVANITGVSQEVVSDHLISVVSQGLGYNDAIRGIADAITQAWNLRIKDDAPIAQAEAVINSLAAELFASMVHGKNTGSALSNQFFERVDILVDKTSGVILGIAKDSDKLRKGKPQESHKLVSRYLPRKSEEGQESISTVLPALLGVPADDVVYFDPSEIEVSDAQQHSSVPLSRAEKTAQERQQQTGFTLNRPFMQIHSLFSEQDMINLFGEPLEDTMNVVTRESAEGKNTTVMGGWNQVKSVVAQVTAEAETRGVPADELPIYYRFESISTARSMMRGRYNPQSDKGMRQAFTSMQSVADLTNPDHKLLWDTAALQMTGARVYAMKPEDISAKADALFAEPEMVAAIDAIAQAFHGNKDITGASLVPLLKAAAAKTDDGLTNELIHVLTDRVRYNMADETERKNFKSRLYIEADGVANGPAGAIAMLTAADSPTALGAFIRAAAKTGFFIGDPTMNMNTFRQDEANKDDTYATAGSHASDWAWQRLFETDQKLKSGKLSAEAQKTLLKIDIQHRTTLDVLSSLMPDSSFQVIENSETGMTSLKISRKVAKNPATITVYGSGKRGIAGNLAGVIAEEIASRISRAAKEGIDIAEAFGGQEAYARLMQQLQRLTVDQPGYRKGESGVQYIWNPNSKKQVWRNLPKLVSKKGLADFKFSPVEVESLVANLTEFFVSDLNMGIHQALGSSVLNNSALMVAASNWQSAAAIHTYNTELEKLIAEKVAADPEWDYVRNGFSKNDLKALRQKIKAIAPILRTAVQAWDTNTSARAASEHVAGSTITGRYPVPHLQRTPTLSGVRVAPFLVIGMGDAAMVTNLLNDMDLPTGTMQVYDGINLPFMQAREGGAVANKAIADAWLNNNPMRTLLESFEAIAASMDIDAVLNTLRKTNPHQAKKMLDGPSPEQVLERLRDGAARVDALHAAIKEVGYAMDQMAATGATHSVEGTATAEDAEAMLAEAYYKHLGTVQTPLENKQIGEWFRSIPVDASGNRTIYAEGLQMLTKRADFDPVHREMVRRILAVHSERLKDLQVVMLANAESDLSKYLTPAQEAALKAGAVNGYWLEGQKTLVLGAKLSSETIAHEMTHAATFQLLLQFFIAGLPDTKWGRAVSDSILSLSSLMMEFDERGADGKLLNREAAKVFAGFREVLANILRTPETEPGASIASMWGGASQSQRAQAVAEFVAHVTTNDRLRSLAKSTLVKRIKDSVIRFLRMVVLGPLGLDVKGPVTNDILSQVQFHTEVISAAQADMARRGVHDLLTTPADPLAQSTLTPNDTQAVLMSSAFEQRVGRYLASASSVFETIGRATEALKATTMAGDLATDAAAAGFLQTPAQRLAFTQMVAALSTQAKIAPAVAQASHKLYAQALEALDGKLTADQQDFLRGRTGLRVDAHDRSTLVPAFVALGLVDPVMRNALAGMNTEGRAKIKGNLDQKLEALGNNALAAVQDMLTGTNRSKNAEEALANMAEMIAKQAHIEQNLVTRMEAATMGAMGKANDWVANTLADKSRALSKAASVKAGKTKSKTMKAAAQTTALVANVFSDAGAAANAEAALSMVNKGKSDFLKGLVKDLTGRVDSNALVYDLIKQVGQRVSKARQFYREQLPTVIAKVFSKVPSEEQSTTMFKTLAKTGLASLVQGDNFAAAYDMALDDTKRAAEITRIEGELKKQTPRTEGRIRKKAKLLAEYMTTGVVQAGLLRNADAVANLLDDGVSGMTAPGVAEQSKVVVDLVDQLITLYAVDKAPAQQLEAMRQLRSAEPEGTERVLGVLKHQMDADRARHTGAARFNAWKGYIPSDGAAGGSLIVADTRDHKNLTRKGYRKVADYKGTSLFNTGNMAYYYTPVGKAPFNQGIIQNARMTAGGVDQSTGFAVGFPTAGRITQKATVERLARNAHLDSSREALLAVYDDKGKVIAFERSIDPDQLERLKPSTNILAMLGQWMGRQAEEEMAQAVNFDAVAKVHEMWNTGKHRKGEFVNVLDAKSYGNDPVLKDALRILPADVVKHAESLFGTGRFMVRKDMLEDVFGYRDASIGDVWTGNSRWSPKTQERVRKLAEMYLGDDAFRLLVQGEERWKNLVKDAKTLIVVKSAIVPAANFVANIFQMLARGVPMSTIARGLRDKTLEVDFYVKTHVEQMDLAVQLMALGSKDTNQRQKLEAHIQAIEDSWKHLSIWPLLAAGEFGSITDAGISRDEILLSEGKLQAYIEAKTEKLPPALQRAGKWALITKDTALFQGLQKSMEYGDFLAKAIVYEHHLAKGKTKVEALGVITDEFVNYDRHPGRVRGYVEDLGLAWFYNYKLRIAKTAFNMIRKDPLRVALLAGMGLPGTELPVTENVFTKAIEGTLGHSIGPGMLFSAPGLNPWVAAMQ